MTRDRSFKLGQGHVSRRTVQSDVVEPLHIARQFQQQLLDRAKVPGGNEPRLKHLER